MVYGVPPKVSSVAPSEVSNTMEITLEPDASRHLTKPASSCCTPEVSVIRT